MIYGSVCSGIEAATVAWHPLGWKPKFFAEIEAFPSAVLAHHYGSNMPGDTLSRNGVPNHGDFTKIGAGAGPVDLLVGGTPCQSFSIAGKRLGLDDPRGNLALEYLALAKRLGARWFVWENVRGVLSSFSGSEQANREVEKGAVGGTRDCDEDRDLAMFLSFVRECGFGFAYRVLDAQYVRVDGFPRAVPQRRERIVVVGYLGDWRPAAAVLFEPEGLRWNTPPGRQTREAVAGAVTASSGRRGGTDDPERGKLIATHSDISATVSSKWSKGTGGPAGDEAQNLVAHTLRAEGFDASEDGTGRGTPIVPVGFNWYASPSQQMSVDTIAPALKTTMQPAVHADWQVRRLTPRECERLQGFPDDYTDVRFGGKGHAADGPRYKALGNSMAVNFMRWIGMRIDIMDGLIRSGRVAP